ncbi:hypothetical protein [Paracoccus beibuensis]|uniref:hypothetical protein n=1 Tax=Paracoccus beibuensis TaxID=547602 RepID=UPI00223F9C06|nr:hypothetical protein [Paracoccus beibuensis]
MVKEPKPSRGMPRSLIYAAIPGGFLVLVLVLFLSGWFESDEPQAMEEARESAEERSE